MSAHRNISWPILCGLIGISFALAGCHNLDVIPDCPRELTKVNLPDYAIEPPDVLVLDSIRLVPKPPYRVEPGDVIFIQATNTPADRPISGAYRIEPDGSVRLGPSYGSVNVDQKTIEEANKTIETHLAKS